MVVAEENIASGVATSNVTYLNGSYSNISVGAVEGLTNEQLLFVAWGQGWCTLATPESARLRVTTDTHSPPQFRVTGPVSHNPAFAKAFGCKEGQPMRPKNLCEVW